MPVKKIDYLKVDGKECCRCGAPFYRMTNLDLTDIPEAPATSPYVLRSRANPLNWQWMNRSDISHIGKYPKVGWYLSRVEPTPDGVFCTACSRRDDKWMGIEGRPHIGVN